MPQRVKGEGPQKCLMAIVGEAYGETEKVLGRPFVGSAGTLLNTKLHNAGIARQSCYITNVINEQPPRNDFAALYWQGKEPGLHPTPRLLELRQELLEELDELDTNLIVALGNNALWALTGQYKIGRWRGSILSTQLPSGRRVKVIGTYHPASALREYSFSHIIETDLVRAKFDSGFFDLCLPQRDLLIAPSLNEVLSFAASCLGKRDVCFDIESTPEHITCISLSTEPERAMSIPTTKSYWGSMGLLKSVLDIINGVLTQAKTTNVGQNITFDIQYLLRFMAILPSKPWDDTMIMQHSCYCELPKGLDFLTSVYTREPYYKDDLKVWMGGDRTENEKLWLYNAKDAAVTLECCYVLRKEMAELNVTYIYDHMMELLEPLLFMMLRGVKFDHAAAEAHKVIYSELQKEAEKKVKAKYGDINVRSPKQVLGLLDQLGIDPIMKKNASGVLVPTANKKALEKLASKSPELQEITNVKENAKLINDYIEVALDEVDGRLRCSYNSTGTGTGRLSSSKSVFGCGTNLQNWPIKVRDMLIADEGLVITGADLAGAESRVVAYECGDPLTIKLFEEGAKIHKHTACMVFGVTPDQVDADKKKLEDLGKDTETMYFRAKKLRHSIEKLGTWVTVKEQLNISAADAKALVQRFKDTSPMFMKWTRELDMQLRKDRTIISPTGRKRKFLDRFGDDMLREAVAFIPQDVISHVINTVIKRFYYEVCSLPEHNLTQLLLQIHDAVYIQHKPEQTKEVHDFLAAAAKAVTFKAHGKEYHIPLDIKTGPNCRDLHKVDFNDPQWLIKLLPEAIAEEVLWRDAVGGNNANPQA